MAGASAEARGRPDHRGTPVNAAAQSVAIVGAGSIGVAWTLVFARGGHAVALHDSEPARLTTAGAELADRLDEMNEAGLLEEPADQVRARVRFCARLDATVAGVQHVQECVPENRGLKRALFAELDGICEPAATLASSSSTLTATEIAGDLAGRARCLVVHPANPPHLLPVVELVPAPFTDPAVLDRCAKLLELAGMSPVHVRREVTGFVFNRLQGAILREAMRLVGDGVAAVEDVDRVVRDGLGRRWAVIGPFETVDLNTRGGIEAHARRLGPAYARMGAERGEADNPWTPDVVERVTTERRRLLPLESWEERVIWRDRALMAAERCRRESWPDWP